MNMIYPQIETVMLHFGSRSLLLLITILIGTVVAKSTYKLSESLGRNLKLALSIFAFLATIVYFTERSHTGLFIVVPCGLFFLAIAMILDTYESKNDTK